ncbi:MULTISPECIES: NAD(P)/FAD-dependent oxidoreductase [unclassified Cryobacterium]|uniref:NAD(P)/FAD-dependent oxidoreductase n=1 Tax=unclassified Cryobacterium TaxID=2649013 RepID=UPI00106D8663|nr:MULTISPECIES: NAD(P)/FAD-dependent oxidoreductase [unclassified Cryobacterium]TFC51059.1 NAD(P)/FAD-dependent oxidoreductase [Cryobacterium sp. TMB3-1-2]TFC74405.1 NAD(P)/FAD-dependent oxidoreductase [Cryobacterium sp. TMB3-15]TFC79918.1 NAD(P)/FAD-dependent oxidoreductase [Cryobacterium sp. TMB3-10]TFD41819.1 NAD(P)/FAD-dependent oxidoreductase [Cryobacterium sp. TMB3-12]
MSSDGLLSAGAGSDSAAGAVEAPYDVVIIGAGPAGLAAGLNLVRARRRTLMIDSNRPRHSATLRSHGFITRDGVPPLELRRIGREEYEAYPAAEFHMGLVRSVEQLPDAAAARFTVSTKGMRGEKNRVVTARTVLIATGLAETLPALPSIRAWYGTNLHSCIACDGYEEADRALALIGETDDLAEHALLISQWTDDLIVFTNGVGQVTDADEAALAARGIRVDRRPLTDVVGERGAMTGIQVADGEFVAREGGFVRPKYEAAATFAASLTPTTDAVGLLVVDDQGRTSVPGLYAAGDTTPPGPEQLLVSAGEGARAAVAINRELLGPLATHPPVNLAGRPGVG